MPPVSKFEILLELIMSHMLVRRRTMWVCRHSSVSDDAFRIKSCVTCVKFTGVFRKRNFSFERFLGCSSKYRSFRGTRFRPSTSAFAPRSPHFVICDFRFSPGILWNHSVLLEDNLSEINVAIPIDRMSISAEHCWKFPSSPLWVFVRSSGMSGFLRAAWSIFDTINDENALVSRMQKIRGFAELHIHGKVWIAKEKVAFRDEQGASWIQVLISLDVLTKFKLSAHSTIFFLQLQPAETMLLFFRHRICS